MEGGQKKGGREFLRLEMRKGSVLFRYIFFDHFEGDCSDAIKDVYLER